MAATYDPTLATDRDWVRFLIGDRGPTTFRLTDEEIDAVLAEEANKYMAAYRCAVAIYSGASGAGLIRKAVDDLRLEFSDDADGAFWSYVNSLKAKGVQLMQRTPSTFRTLGSRGRC